VRANFQAQCRGAGGSTPFQREHMSACVLAGPCGKIEDVNLGSPTHTGGGGRGGSPKYRLNDYVFMCLPRLNLDPK
jgi:hypothetical protein